ncbi:MAG: HAD family hydrolase [Carbonactinosporaceae bacterium]
MSTSDLAALLDQAKAILLDFDGPVCNIFAGHPAPLVADQLRQVLTNAGVDLPTSVAAETDPLEVLRWTATLDRDQLTRVIEDSLRADELTAAETAVPTPYAREVIVAATQEGRKVSIASNNSEPAIAAYLTNHRLNRHITRITGRTPYQPDQMKPNPASVRTAVEALSVAPHSCLLIGDSPTDITAGHALGMPVIGYANKPSKTQRLQQAGADAIATSMSDIALALIGVAPS